MMILPMMPTTATSRRILSAFFMFQNLAHLSTFEAGAKRAGGDSIRGVTQVVLAHGSGIDDVLWFLIPVVLALFVLRRAERRATRSKAETDSLDATAPRAPEQ
jgi:hypothetical protein